MPKESHEDVGDPEPLKPLDFAILVALNEQDRHGYGIMKAVNQQFARAKRFNIETGNFRSLERRIARLQNLSRHRTSPMNPPG